METSRNNFDPELLAGQRPLVVYTCYPNKPNDKDILRVPIEDRAEEHKPPIIGIGPYDDTSDIPQHVLLCMNPVH